MTKRPNYTMYQSLDYSKFQSGASIIDDNGDDGITTTESSGSKPKACKVNFGLPLKLALAASLVLNLASIFLLLGKANYTQPAKSRFAALTRNVPRAWLPDTSNNETAQDELWEATNFDRGNVALDDRYAQEMGLPRAQRFPWDSSKGIYLINAYHNLHCVKTIRTAVVDFHTQTPQTIPYLHIIHCLNALRDEIMCDADDTPRYTWYQPSRKSGLGQIRMCRDWTQLESWADQHTRHGTWLP